MKIYICISGLINIIVSSFMHFLANGTSSFFFMVERNSLFIIINILSDPLLDTFSSITKLLRIKL